MIAVNFTAQPIALMLSGLHRVEVASDGMGESAPFEGHLAPDQALVLKPEAV